jgi:hypothetical protein
VYLRKLLIGVKRWHSQSKKLGKLWRNTPASALEDVWLQATKEESELLSLGKREKAGTGANEDYYYARIN